MGSELGKGMGIRMVLGLKVGWIWFWDGYVLWSPFGLWQMSNMPVPEHEKSH